MPVRLPTVEQILEIAEIYGLHLTEEDARSFRGVMAGPIASYRRIDELAEPRPRVKYPREPGYRPPPEENPYNAWYWRCEIRGTKKGVLAGKTVAVGAQGGLAVQVHRQPVALRDVGRESTGLVDALHHRHLSDAGA